MTSPVTNMAAPTVMVMADTLTASVGRVLYYFDLLTGITSEACALIMIIIIHIQTTFFAFVASGM